MKNYILILFFGLTATLNAQYNIKLNVPLVKQEQTKWCGVAASKCLLDYHGYWTQQCEIMEYVRNVVPWYGITNCCDNALDGCNDDGIPLGIFSESGSVKDVLVKFGNMKSTVYPHPIGIPNIANFLQDDRPQIIHLQSKTSLTAHAVVIHGVKLDWIYLMDPDTNIIGFDSLKYYELLDDGRCNWLYTLVPLCCDGRSGQSVSHCCNGIQDGDEEGIDCGGSCPPCGELPPPPCSPPHCCNGIKDGDEDDIDCGGSCPPCEPPPPICSNCKKDSGEFEIDCGGDCPPCEDVLDEITITNTSQLRPEVMAYSKITTDGDVKVKSGEKVSFITEEDGLIILLPGFKAESGSNFSTQRWEDLSGNSRICPEELCRDVTYLSHHHSVSFGGDFLRIYHLLYAEEIEYRIHLEGKREEIYSNSLNITRNGTFELWDCVTGTENPEGTVNYYVVYVIFYCNGKSYGGTHHFYVNYPSGKSLTEEPEESETPNTLLSPPISNNIILQDGNTSPSFVIIPNPNAGTFQLETNFPLSEIASLKVVDMLGVSVYETKTVLTHTIQLDHAATGLYFVVAILKDGRVLTQKMMVGR